MKAQRLVALVLAFSFFAGACASTTLIKTDDPNVKIYVDDEFVGTGSASHTDTKIVGSTTSVQLKKEGCQTEFHSFSRNEEFDAGACAGGVFLLFPFLWIQKYRAVHSYEFSCQKVSK